MPAIVPRELWQAAHRPREEQPFGAGRYWRRPYLLSRRIQCGHGGTRYQARRRDRGRVYASYVCGGYVASGREVCPSPSIPARYLDEAVLDGTQKRLEPALDLTELSRRIQALVAPSGDPEATVRSLAASLRETEAKIGRLVAALAAGLEDVPSVRAHLLALERQRERLERDLAQARKRLAGGGRAHRALLEELVFGVRNLRELLENGDPEERQAVVRTLLAGVRVEPAKHRIVLRWYRLPQHLSVKLVAVGGIEPPTRGL